MRKTLIVLLAASSIGLVFLTMAAVLTEPRVFMLATPTGNGDRYDYRLGWKRNGIYAIRYVTPHQALTQDPVFQQRTNRLWSWIHLSLDLDVLITADQLTIAPKTTLMAAALLALYPTVAFFRGPVKR